MNNLPLILLSISGLAVTLLRLQACILFLEIQNETMHILKHIS